MKTIELLFLGGLFLLFPFLNFAQHECAFDHYHPTVTNEDLERQINDQILDRILIERSSGGGNEILTIPVVIHLIHNNGPENIPDEQIELGLERLNDAFASVGNFSNPNGVDTGIRFCLAQRDPEGNFSTGINRVVSELTEMYVPSQDQELKDLSRWDPELYLNIWIVENIIREPNNSGVIGYATFPDSHGLDNDGVVCEAALFGAVDWAYDKVQIHEIGHYLGLYHTFQDGCPNDDCLLSGDRVCDTPPDQLTFTAICYNGANSCDTDEDDTSDNNPFRPVELGGLGDQVDEQDNFMDYSNLYCFTKFSQGQAERMRASVLEIRSSLLDGLQCVPPCESPIDLNILSEGTTAEVGESLSFANLSDNFNSTEWYLDGELVSTADNYTFDAVAEGSYELEVVVSNDDPGCYQELIYFIEVICPISAVFDGITDAIETGAELNFQGPDGVSSYDWQVDGESTSDTQNFNYTFNESGIISITLVVSNGLCEDSYTWNIAVGNCNTGNEANIWPFFTLNGIVFGFNFNEDDILITDPQNFSNSSHNRCAYSDAAGNLLMSTNGTQILDRNYDIMENGTGLNTSPSSHYGSLFIKHIDNDLVYLFTADDDESNYANGIQYHLIDPDANDGLGEVVLKNQALDSNGSESFACVRHCNLVDFWLAFYDFEENLFKAYLITEDGIADEPVISNFTLGPETLTNIRKYAVNGPGSQIVYDKYLMNFDPGTGEASLQEEFILETIGGYSFSHSNRYLYYKAGDLDTKIYRYDLFAEPEDWLDTQELLFEGSFNDYGIGMGLAPDGKIYMEEVVSGYVSIIENPDADSEELIINDNAIFTQNLINGFMNFYHAYIYGPSLFLQGPWDMCAGDIEEFSVFKSDCLSSDVEWQFSGPIALTELENGVVSIETLEPGEFELIATMDLECGTITDTLIVTIDEPILNFDLGPDRGFCPGESVLIDAGEGFDSYAWTNGEESSSILTDETGTYGVTVFRGACRAYDEVEVTGELNVGIDLGEDIFLCDGEIAILDAGTDYFNFSWQDGTTGQFYTAYEPGLYIVTSEEPCFATDSLVVTDCDQDITGISELSSGILIYPNPGSGILNVRSEFPIDSWKLYDVEGRLVTSESAGQQKNIQLDISDLSKGLYNIVILNDRKVVSKLVIRE